jgi:alkaline phosphatase
MNLSGSDLKKLEDAFNMSMKKSSERPNDDDTYLLYGGYEPLSVTLTHILNQKCGISWTTYSHTGLPVTTFALGNCQELFNGYYDNTEIFKKMVYALN